MGTLSSSFCLFYDVETCGVCNVCVYQAVDDLCKVDTGQTTVVDNNDLPHSVYLSVTRDGSVWLRAGQDHTSLDCWSRPLLTGLVNTTPQWTVGQEHTSLDRPTPHLTGLLVKNTPHWTGQDHTSLDCWSRPHLTRLLVKTTPHWTGQDHTSLDCWSRPLLTGPVKTCLLYTSPSPRDS